jgi:hypothetical protein
MSTEVIEHQKVSAIVDNYRQIQDDVRKALELLIGARERMEATFGGIYSSIFEGSTLSELSLDRAGGKCERRIRKQAWEYLITQLQLSSFLSEARLSELKKQIIEDKLPEITSANVYATLESITNNLPALFNEAAIAVFDRLRVQTHQTNRRYAIGRKAILSHIVDARFGTMSLSHHYDQSIRSIDNVFHLLDGRGSPKYPDDLVTHIRKSMTERMQSCETEYFRCQWFKAGTLHIWFKRADLVTKLNEVGGKAHGPMLGAKERGARDPEQNNL